jgi:hypothetical protein
MSWNWVVACLHVEDGARAGHVTIRRTQFLRFHTDTIYYFIIVLMM